MWFLCYRYVGSFLPVGVIVLKVSKIHRKCQDSGVMVEPKIIIGTFNPLDLLRRKVRQPGDIQKKFLDLFKNCKILNHVPVIGK